MLEEFIANYLSNRTWRLNNLYSVVDKEDNVVQFKLNDAQIRTLSIKHPKSIILKSRQRGISTYKVIENLDKCLFTPNSQTGIQSYGQSEAKKLYKKALFAWEELDQDIKDILGIKLTSANAEGMMFSNNSTLKVGNFRGDTLSSLHVSELAKIAKKFPEKAEELNTGAFEAVSTNSSISIESTAEGDEGLFADIWHEAERRLKLVGAEGLTNLDFYPLFLSWVDDDDCNLYKEYTPSDDDIEYFKELEDNLNITLTDSQKWWCSAKRTRLGNDFDREYPYSPEKAFQQSVEGTYYKIQYESIIAEKRVCSVPHTPRHPVYAIFDLGMNDEMAINFTQVINGVPRIIGEYSNSGLPISYYVDIMSKLPYPIKMVYLPHDANVKELSTGRTRIEEFRRLGVTCRLLKRLPIQDGINSARQYLSTVLIDNSCKGTIKAIQNYRQKYDKRLQVYMGVPEHDEFSHFADVIRYSSLGLTYHKVKQTITKSDEELYNIAKSDSISGVAL